MAKLDRVLLIGIVVLLLISIGTQAANVLPPVEYTQSSYDPEQSNLCPSQFLKFSTESRINLAPVTILLSHSIWSVDKQDNVLFGGQIETEIFTMPTKIHRQWSIVIPNIPPGYYEYRLGVQTINSASEAISVPFTIRSDCDNPLQLQGE